MTATGTNVFAGGLVGLNRGTIDACYAVSKVVNSESAFLPGGLVGNDSGSILASYWGLETSSSLRGVGYGVSTGSTTGLIVVAMSQPTSFAGWDFSNTWMLGSADTIPLLRALASSYGSPVGVDPATARVRPSCSWKRTGNRLTVEVPGASFEVVVYDLNGRILAHASGTGMAELELKSSRSLIVGIHSKTVNKSFAIAALR